MKTITPKQPSLWAAYFIVNTILLILASLVFPNIFVLGNASFPFMVAAVISGLLLTVGRILTPPLADMLDIKAKKEEQWLLIFWDTNSLFVWLIARLAILTGFGIASFWGAIFWVWQSPSYTGCWGSFLA